MRDRSLKGAYGGDGWPWDRMSLASMSISPHPDETHSSGTASRFSRYTTPISHLAQWAQAPWVSAPRNSPFRWIHSSRQSSGCGAGNAKAATICENAGLTCFTAQANRYSHASCTLHADIGRRQHIQWPSRTIETEEDPAFGVHILRRYTARRGRSHSPRVDPPAPVKGRGNEISRGALPHHRAA